MVFTICFDLKPSPSTLCVSKIEKPLLSYSKRPISGVYLFNGRYAIGGDFRKQKKQTKTVPKESLYNLFMVNVTRQWSCKYLLSKILSPLISINPDVNPET